MKVYVVEIVEGANGKVLKRFEESSQHNADKVERGVLHNLNVGQYFTRQSVEQKP